MICIFALWHCPCQTRQCTLSLFLPITSLAKVRHFSHISRLTHSHFQSCLNYLSQSAVSGRTKQVSNDTLTSVAQAVCNHCGKALTDRRNGLKNRSFSLSLHKHTPVVCVHRLYTSRLSSHVLFSVFEPHLLCL